MTSNKSTKLLTKRINKLKRQTKATYNTLLKPNTQIQTINQAKSNMKQVNKQQKHTTQKHK